MSNNSLETLNDKYLRLWGTPAIVLSALLGLMFFYFPNRWDLFAWYLMATFFYVILTWEIGRIIILRVRLKLPGLENTTQRVLQTILYATLVTGIANAVIKAVLYHFGLKPPSLASTSFFRSYMINFGISLFFVVLLCTAYEAIYFFEQYRIALQKAEKLKRQQVQQQLDLLKNKVNPHFLFNSLTTLSALIGEDAPKAEQFVDELSKVYRYMLRTGRQPFATVNEELQFAGWYEFLLKNRFEDGAFSLKLPDAGHQESNGHFKATDQKVLINRMVPVMSLQNALDFLVRTQNVPLHIAVFTDNNQLIISCDNNPKTLSFDASDTDWQQLERNHVIKMEDQGQLLLSIPITINTI